MQRERIFWAQNTAIIAYMHPFRGCNIAARPCKECVLNQVIHIIAHTLFVGVLVV
jgi:hypothetical protein